MDDADVREKFSAYMNAVRTAAMPLCQPDGVYAGENGAMRLARECGPAMLDFGDYGEQSIGSTYSGICVIAYGLKPPIDAKTWLKELRTGMEKARKIKNERRYDP